MVQNGLINEGITSVLKHLVELNVTCSYSPQSAHLSSISSSSLDIHRAETFSDVEKTPGYCLLNMCSLPVIENVWFAISKGLIKVGSGGIIQGRCPFWSS